MISSGSVQRARIHSAPWVRNVVSYISQFVTLGPGDVIYTGTPGTTKPMQPGDVVEIEVEGVGVLRNRIARAVTAMD